MSRADKVWIKLMNMGKRFGCHQMAERSFFIKGYQFPICARCTGVLIGEILMIIAMILGFRIKTSIAIILFAIMVLDGGLQYKKILYSTNTRRLITGICAGIGLTHIYYLVINFIINIIK